MCVCVCVCVHVYPPTVYTVYMSCEDGGDVCAYPFLLELKEQSTTGPTPAAAASKREESESVCSL